MNLKYIQQCRICNNPHLREILYLGSHTLQGCFEYPNQPKPSLRRIPNKILRCDTTKQKESCGLVQSHVIVPPEILYSNYGYRSSVNPIMVNHLNNVANKILGLIPDPEVVVSIAENDGTCLQNFPQTARRIAIDPSNIALECKSKGIELINDIFPTSKLYSLIPNSFEADIFISLACLYDIDDLHNFVEEITNYLKDDGIWVFEVAYLVDILKAGDYAYFAHEHVSLFSLNDIEFLLKKHDLKVFKAELTPTNGGSILVYACRGGCDKYDTQENKKNLKNIRFREFDLELDEITTYANFRTKVNNHRENLTRLLAKLKNKRRTLAILGNSTKMNCVLDSLYLDPACIFDHGSERDPRKHGGKTLHGIPMIPEEESRKKTDVYVLGPTHFIDGILEREKEFLNRGGKIISPFPEIAVYDKNGKTLDLDSVSW